MTHDRLLGALVRQMAEAARRLDRVAPLALPWPLRIVRGSLPVRSR